MVNKVVHFCLLPLLGSVLLPMCSTQESFTVVINRYTSDATFVRRDNITFGTQLILVCRVVGLPYGTPLNYTWTCPNGPCEVEGYYGRKVFNEHILAANITSTSDGGAYTCQVTAVVGSLQQVARNRLQFTVTGGVAFHSYGRLLPTNFLLTEPEQIEGPDGVGRVNCTTTGTFADFQNGSQTSVTEDNNEDLHQIHMGASATLIVKSTRRQNFSNALVYCNGHSLYLHLSAQNALPTPRPIQVTEAGTRLQYQVAGEFNSTGQNLIGGLHVTRFGVPMVVVYMRVSQPVVVVQSVVPGASYDIAVWGVSVDNTRRSGEPSRQTAVVEERRPSTARRLTVTRVFQDGIELNWLPPTEPNGEVHYVIYYTPEGGTEQSIDTESNLTHYNLTGLERNRVYTNIAVQAVNSAGRSGIRQNAIVTNYSHTVAAAEMKPPGGPNAGQNVTYPTYNSYTKIILVGVPSLVVLLLLLCITLLAVCVACVVWRKRHCRTDQKGEVSSVHVSSNNTGVAVETSTSHPNSYLGQVTANRPEIRLEPRQSCIYCSVIRAKDHHQDSPMRSLYGNRTNNSTDGGTTEGGDEYGALSKDDMMNVKQYQSLRADQVQVHHYASLGATAEDEGSAQSYI